MVILLVIMQGSQNTKYLCLTSPQDPQKHPQKSQYHPQQNSRKQQESPGESTVAMVARDPEMEEARDPVSTASTFSPNAL